MVLLPDQIYVCVRLHSIYQKYFVLSVEPNHFINPQCACTRGL